MQEFTHEAAALAGLIAADELGEAYAGTLAVPVAGTFLLDNRSTHLICISLETRSTVTAAITSRPAEVTVVKLDETEAVAFQAAYVSAAVQEWVQAGLLIVTRVKPLLAGTLPTEPPPTEPPPVT